jgi:hypothetical protein
MLELHDERRRRDHDVQIHVVPGGEPVGVSTMRVNLSKVSAWWPLKAQGVHVTYSSTDRDR